MQAMFGFFSWALFIIAVFIFLYFIIEIVWEVTQTGSPLGETLANTWIPLRLVAAFGLLLPINGYGLNSAQYITLYTAKLGSGLATNAWGAFNMMTGTNPTGMSNEQLIGVLGYQDLSNLLKGLMVMKSCEQINYWGVIASAVSGIPTATAEGNGALFVAPYIINGNQGTPLYDNGTMTGVLNPVGGVYDPTPIGVVTGAPTDAFAQVLSHSEAGGIRMVIGFVDPAQPKLYEDYPGSVLPVCGEIFIPVSGYNPESLLTAEVLFLRCPLHITRSKTSRRISRCHGTKFQIGRCARIYTDII